MRQLPEVMQTEALIGWNDLRPDDPTTVAKIRDVAGRLTTETVIYVVSALNLMLGAVRGPVPSTKREQQIGLAQDLLPRSLVNQVVVRLANGTIDRVFHTEQLLLAARIAIEFGQQGAFQAVDREFVGELLLRTNDCLMSRPGRTRDDIVAMALRQLGAFPHEQERYLLPRYHDLLVTRARSGTQPDALDKAFEAFSGGVSIDAFLALGLAYAALFTSIQRPPDLAGFDRVVQEVEERLKQSPEATKVRALLTAEPSWYRRSPITSTSLQELAGTDLAGFYERPFVRLSNGSALPISMRLALERLSSGLYWSAFTGRRAHDTGIVDLNAYLGELFQSYITEAAVAAYAKGGRHVAIPESEVAGAGGHISCPDLILLDGTRLVSVETTVTSLKMGTQVAADVREFRRELRSAKFKRKLMQPSEGASNLLTGRLKHERVAPEKLTDVYPVLLTLWPLPQFVATRVEVDAVYTAPSGLLTKTGRRVRVHPLQFLSAEEFEMLEPGWEMGAGLSDALGDKDAGDPKHNTSMKNYMFGRVQREHQNHRMANLFTNLGEQSRPILGKLLGESEAPGDSGPSRADPSR
jgi:hypothetical protein